MTTEDQTSLINTPVSGIGATQTSKCFCRRWFIVVEPLIILYCVVAYPMAQIDEQILYQKVGEHLGIDVANLSDVNHTQGKCDVAVDNSSDYILRERVQAETAKFGVYLALIEYPVSIIMLLIYGAYSDVVGRKFMFVLAPFGSLYKAVLYLIVVYFNLNVYFIFLRILEYVFGNLQFLLAASFSILADNVDRKYLAIRFIIVDALTDVGAAIGETGLGVWVKSAGFLWPIIFIVCGKTLILLYAIFIIPKSSPKRNQDELSKDGNATKTGTNPCDALRLFTDNDQLDRRKALFILLGAVLLSRMWHSTSLTTLYQMNSPLCWDASLIGYYNATLMLMGCLGMLSGVVLKKWIPLSWLILIGYVSYALQHTMNIFVRNSVMMFMVPVIGTLAKLPTPLTRRVLSARFGAHQQGSLFSLISSVFVVCDLLSKAVANNIYAATLTWMETFVFLVAAVSNALSTFLALWFIMLGRQHAVIEVPVPTNEEPGINN